MPKRGAKIISSDPAVLRKTEEGEIRPADWRETHKRILVAPSRGYTVGVTFYRSEIAGDGTTVKIPVSRELEIRVRTNAERDLLGWGTLVEEPTAVPTGTFDIQHAERGRFHELPEALPPDSTVASPSERSGPRIPLYGSSLVVDDDLWESFQSRWSSYEDFVLSISSGKNPFALYGKRYAFIDDAEGMERLLPKFAAYLKRKEHSRDDESAVLEAVAQNVPVNIGPPLSRIEPQRFEKHPKTGRLW